MNPTDLLQSLGGHVEGALWVSMLVMGAAAVTAAILRTRSAALRHRVWTVAVGTLLVIPLLAAVTVSWLPQPLLRVPSLVSHEESERLSGETPQIAGSAATAAGELPQGMRDQAAKPTSAPTPASVFPVVWFAGVLLLTVALVRRLRQLFIQLRRAREVEELRVLSLHNRLHEELGIGRPVRLLVGSPEAMPLTWGLRRHLIVIPASALRWPDRRLEALLRHELAHVERGDARVQLLVEVVRILYWMNPLVWYAARRMVVEREQASDDRVVSGEMQAVDYAAELLEIASNVSFGRPTAAVAMAARGGRSLLAARIRAILDPTRSRVAPSVSFTMVLAVLFVTLPAATIGQNSADGVGPVDGEVDDAKVAAPGPSNASPSTNPPLRPQRLSLMQAPSPDCLDRNLRGTNSNRNADKGGLEKSASWRTPLCSGHLYLAGRLQSDPDSFGTSGISPGGSLRIEHVEGGSVYVLEFRSDGTSGSRFTGSLNEKDLEPRTVRDFMFAMLPAIERFTGLTMLP